jgi:hypothetical protein
MNWEERGWKRSWPNIRHYEEADGNYEEPVSG